MGPALARIAAALVTPAAALIIGTAATTVVATEVVAPAVVGSSTTIPAGPGWLNNLGEFGKPAAAWNIAANWRSDSAQLASLLASNTTRANLSIGSYGVATFFASSTDPTMTVTNTNGWGTKPNGGSFKCPAAAKPASGTDAHMACVQPDGSVWDMWKTARTGTTTWTSGGVSYAAPGVYSYPIAGSRGSSFSLLSGLVTPNDWNGDIEHALLCVTASAATSKAYVYPSTSSDGTLTGGIPEGSRLVLDPSVSLTGLSPLAQRIGKTWQRYGCIVGDKTGTDLSMLGIAPETWTALGQTDPWVGLGISGYPDLSELLPLIPRLRIQIPGASPAPPTTTTGTTTVAPPPPAALNVRTIAESSTTVTLGWTATQGLGYVFSVDGARVSNTFDPSRSSVKFWKLAGTHTYGVTTATAGLVGAVQATR